MMLHVYVEARRKESLSRYWKDPGHCGGQEDVKGNGLLYSRIKLRIILFDLITYRTREGR